MRRCPPRRTRARGAVSRVRSESAAVIRPALAQASCTGAVRATRSAVARLRRPASPQRSAVAFEVLNGALVFFGGGPRLESAEVPPPPGLIRFARVEPVFAAFQLSNHGGLPRSTAATRLPPCDPVTLLTLHPRSESVLNTNERRHAIGEAVGANREAQVEIDEQARRDVGLEPQGGAR